MILSVPVYVERSEEIFTLRPLFFDGPMGRHKELNRGTARFVTGLRNHLEALNKEARHDQIAEYGYCPDLQHQVVSLELPLRRRTARVRLLLVSFRALGRRLAFSPALPELTFEVERNEDLMARAEEVFTAWMRQQEKAADHPRDFDPEHISLPRRGTAWVFTLDLDLTPATRYRSQDDGVSPLAERGAAGNLDGARELQSVGRCFDELYPDRLKRAYFRDAELEQLSRALWDDQKRPVILLGPSGAGKTSLIHEEVRRTLDERGGRFGAKRRFWLLSPQRLISGMSYVGQWEQRLHAVLGEAEKRGHILVFDDLLGLFRAGTTGESTLSVAHLLKPVIEERRVRVVAEMTPEAFRILREVDRGFADLFHPIPVREPSPSDTLTILIRRLRELEGERGTEFEPAILPVVIDLTRRFFRHLAFPGKAATFLERLATKHPDQAVGRDEVIAAMHETSGLSLAFLDGQSKLPRAEVVEALGRRVFGQRAGIEAMADVVSIGKARLNDPTRPLGSLLFLGPTGVGKTECAKSLAAYLFGSEERLLRFDMNEYVAADAPARLVGTLAQPEGLLTSAVRQDPFSVVLLDEIEKAHPDVFDLLLQILGDGRLTDALGRTSDFTNATVILTSNLGAQEAAHALGFGAASRSQDLVFRGAAERFFRPELFNRIDRIVPFGRLPPEEIRRVARLLLDELLEREGLVRRRCLVDIHPVALDRLAAEGHQPNLGARALKRVVERRVARPVATELARLPPDRATVVSVFPVGAAGYGVKLQALREAERVVRASGPTGSLAPMEDAIIMLSRALRPFAPEDGAFVPAELTASHRFYLDIHQRIDGLRRRLSAHLERQSMRAARRPIRPVAAVRQTRSNRLREVRERVRINDLLSLRNIQEYFEENPAPERFPDLWAEEVAQLRREVALLRLCVEAASERVEEAAALLVRPLGAGAARAAALTDSFRRQLPKHLPLELAAEVATDGCFGLLFCGPAAGRLVALEAGSHLFWEQHGGLELVAVSSEKMDGVRDLLREDLRARCARPAPWRRAEAAPAVPEIIRVYDADGTLIDLRTGLVAHREADGTFPNYEQVLLCLLLEGS